MARGRITANTRKMRLVCARLLHCAAMSVVWWVAVALCGRTIGVQTMLSRWIEPASAITFIHPDTGSEYTSLSMEQVKKLRRRGRLDSTLKYRRARHLREQSA